MKLQINGSSFVRPISSSRAKGLVIYGLYYTSMLVEKTSPLSCSGYSSIPDKRQRSVKDEELVPT